VMGHVRTGGGSVFNMVEPETAKLLARHLVALGRRTTR